MSQEDPFKATPHPHTPRPSEKPVLLLLTPEGSLDPFPNPGGGEEVGKMSPSSSQDQKPRRRETLTRTPDASVRSCGRMGETDTHGETREGGAPSLLTHPRRLPLKPRVPVDGETRRRGPPRSLASAKSGIVGHARGVAAGRGAE